MKLSGNVNNGTKNRLFIFFSGLMSGSINLLKIYNFTDKPQFTYWTLVDTTKAVQSSW